MKKIGELLTIVLTGTAILVLMVLSLLGKPRIYSFTERRVLAQLPSLNLQNLRDSSFPSIFETGSLDQFPMRDEFRHLKAGIASHVFRRKDNNGYYTAGGWLSRLDYPLNEENLRDSVRFLHRIYEENLRDTQCRVFLSVIPDKNYYLAPKYGYPTMDYETLTRTVRAGLKEAEYLDLFGALTLEDYYRTDQHWRQERLIDAAQTILRGMGADAESEFSTVTLDTPFYGAFCGQAAVRLPADTISYLTNEVLEGCTVTSYDTGVPKTVPLYDLAKSDGRDAYEMFLNGSDALVVIENPAGEKGKELVIFRDSFGSSLAPLLIPGYSRITLVDFRYVSDEQMRRMVDFLKQDVLFLYSTLILNSSLFRSAGN